MVRHSPNGNDEDDIIKEMEYMKTNGEDCEKKWQGWLDKSSPLVADTILEAAGRTHDETASSSLKYFTSSWAEHICWL